MKLTDWVDRFTLKERPIGNTVSPEIILDQAIAATNFYSGYGALAEHLAIPIDDPAPEPPDPYPDITGETDLTVSEWAIIRPLFLLYVERETGMYLEASRGLGIETFVRSPSEIASEITQMEMEMPHKAFSRAIETIS
jgi:hypothetical protein